MFSHLKNKFHISVLLAATQLMIPALPFSWNGSPTFKTVSGKSTCFVKNVKITVTANKTRILLDPPANQTVVTETLVELLQLNSNLIARVNGGQDTIKDTFNIYGQLCISSNASVAKHTETLQFLTHGDTLDHTY